MSRDSQRVRILALGAVALVAAGGIYALVDWWIAGRTVITVSPPGMRPVDLLEPGALRLVAIVPFFFVYLRWSLTDLSFTQQGLQATLRSLVIAAAAVALARPSWVTTDSKVATVVLVDVSESLSDAQLVNAKGYVDELRASAQRGDADDHWLEVVTFAEKPQVAKRDDQGYVITRHTSGAAAGGAGSDIQAAMQLAYGLYPPGHLPRMVLVTDGNQTVGDLVTEAYRAKEMGVKVSWKTFPADQVKEIRVVGLELPDEIKVGQPFEVKAQVWSTHPETVTMNLRQDEFPNALEPVKTVELREGVNRIAFKAEAKRAGATTFRLKLSKFAQDTEKQNNEAVMTAPVKGKPNILYVEGGVMREPGSAGYLERALEHENMDVEVRGPRGLPSSAKELEKYDLVLVSDVPAHFLGAGQMNALETYVQQLGGGLIMAGGEDSFGSGGYQGTKIEQIMPVRFDAEKLREQPDIALMLVIDRSGSMQGPKLEAAKESARVTTEVLSPNDIIGVIAFDSEAQVFVRPQRAANKMRISADIARLQSAGGTNIYPGLREAFELLQGVNAKVKHVILLSDGEAPYDGIVDLVQDMRAARITISAVGVSGADRNLLSLIADNGDGRLYMTDDIGALPRIFMKETTEAQKSQLVEDLIKVRVAKRVELIEGTAIESAPPLRGYVTTKPKATGEVVLISDLGEPILARWRYGTGTSVAWTSDVKNRWSQDWIAWNGYPKFWAQLVRTTMRRKTYDSYDMFTSIDDGRAKVVVDAIDSSDRFVNALDTDLEVVDPATNQVKQTIPMDQAAAGRYVADFKIERYGSFLLRAVHKRDGKTVAESLGSVALPYPVEYLKTTPDTKPLEQAAQVTDGTDQLAPADAWKATEESVTYTRDLWPWVLLFMAGLIVLDVYAKRVRLFGYRTIKFE